MCQLLAMNCNVPTDICFSFTGFKARGGETDEHQDGWGIAFFEDKGVRTFLDPTPSAKSPIAEFVKNYPIKSKNVISHIRKATVGDINLQNTHPFVREMWGQFWAFAHNGDLKNFSPKLSGRYLPVGSTDSEMAFCYLLEKTQDRFPYGMPEKNELIAFIRDLTKELVKFGTCNFLLSNGDFMITHCSTKLCSIIRKAPFNRAQLKDDDVEVDFSQFTTPTDRVAVIATIPLTDNEEWYIHPPLTLSLFEEGELVQSWKTI